MVTPRLRGGLLFVAFVVVVLLGGCTTNADAPGGTAPASDASAARLSSVRMPSPTHGKPSAYASAHDSSVTGGTSTSASGGTGRGPFSPVVSVVDGDTIKVRLDGRKTTVRLIGVDTPETKKPHVPVQCFGKEASSHLQSLVQSKQVQLVADPTQGEKDKYGRLLRYVYVGETNVALAQIEGGYGREDTYDVPYRFQAQFRAAQQAAQAQHRGTWGGSCHGFHRDDGVSGASPSARGRASASTHRKASDSRPASPPASSCQIKGNISARGEKVAHLPGSAAYSRTKINRPGERMFCSVADATAAGWRIAED